MIFPLLMSLLTRLGRAAWLWFVAVYITVLFSAHGFAASMGFEMHSGNYYWYHSIFNQLPVFLLGITAAHYLPAYLGKTRWFVDLSAFAAFLLLSLSIWNTPYSILMSLLPIATALAFIFLMFFMFRIKDGFYERFLTPLCWVGKISFSMYICHFMVIDFLKVNVPIRFLHGRDWSLLGLYVATVVGTAVIAHFTEKLIEANGIKLGKKVTARISSTLRAKSPELVT